MYFIMKYDDTQSTHHKGVGTGSFEVGVRFGCTMFTKEVVGIIYDNDDNDDEAA
jgi:hypothetical protein